jgi:hypothetical protein
LATTKYRCRQNIGEEEIWTLPKILLSKDYRCRQNIGKEKISATPKYRCRQNISEEKIWATTKYRFCAADFSLLNLPKGKSLGRSNITFNKISLTPKYR